MRQRRFTASGSQSSAIRSSLDRPTFEAIRSASRPGVGIWATRFFHSPG